MSVRERGYFTRPELIEVCAWKTARSRSRVAANTDEEVRALGVTEPANYTVPFWNAYVAACRQIDDQTGFGMRTIEIYSPVRCIYPATSAICH